MPNFFRIGPTGVSTTYIQYTTVQSNEKQLTIETIYGLQSNNDSHDKMHNSFNRSKLHIDR